jgi:hypothetical protein
MVVPDPVAAAALGGCLAGIWALVARLGTIGERLTKVETSLEQFREVCKAFNCSQTSQNTK